MHYPDDDFKKSLNRVVLKVGFIGYGIGFIAGAVTAIAIRTFIVGSL